MYEILLLVQQTYNILITGLILLWTLRQKKKFTLKNLFLDNV